jgi:hypothetical protein
MIDAKKFTCAQLANTFQEDAEAISLWYSGLYNGLGKKRFFNYRRAKGSEHLIIEYCKANLNKTVIEAIGAIFK